MATLHRSLFRVVITRSGERFGVLGVFQGLSRRDDLAGGSLSF